MLLLTESGAGRTARCHVFHYLQMTLEKLSKGYRILPGGDDLPHTHKGASHFIRLIRPVNSVNRPLHAFFNMPPSQIRSYLSSLLPTVNALERLAPALALNSANAEYPWALPDGTRAIAPVDYEFNDRNLSAPRISKLMTFLNTLFDYLINLKEI